MLKHALMLAAVGLALAVPPSGAEEPRHGFPRTISVSGTGEVSTVPDIAYVTVGVRTASDSAREALSQNNAAMEKVLDALKKAGVADKDMQTFNLSLNPRWGQQVNQDGTRTQVQTGYEAANQLRITARDLSTLGGLLDAVTSAGANEMNGIQFDVDDPAKLLAEARARAVKDARATAELYAREAGVELGDVLMISEGGATPPIPMFKARAMSMAAEAVPIAAGEQSVSASISMTFGIK